MKQLTIPPPILRQNINGQEVELGMLWFCQHYINRAPEFQYQTAGAAGLRAAGRIEQAILDGREVGNARLHDVDWEPLRDAVERGDIGAPPTGLVNTQTGRR